MAWYGYWRWICWCGQKGRQTAIDLKRLFRRTRTFEGGVYLPARRERTAGRAIEDFPPPSLLRVPMKQHDGPASTVTVEVGQSVEVGECIGRSDAEGAVCVHAPLTGRVAAIDRVDTARACDVVAVCIEVADGALRTPLGPPLERGVKSAGGDVFDRVEALAEFVDNAGIINGRQPAVGLGGQLRRAAASHVSDIIINAIDSEPMLTADRQLLDESRDTILGAGVSLRDALGARRIWLALDQADRSAFRAYRTAAPGTPIRVIGLRNKYPQHAPVLLTWSVTGREPAYGQSSEDAGVLVVELPTLAALAAAMNDGEPMTRVVVTVSGSAARRPGHYRIPVGTTFADVVRHVGLEQPVVRVIDGGPMTGRAVESLDVVVTKQTRAILLLDRDTDRVALPGPCVRCGWCQEDCPVGLDPQALLDLLERARVAEAARLSAHACVECGLCSYVCPAELPLADAVGQLKRLVPVEKVRK